MSNSETGDERRDRTMRRSSNLPKREGGLCAEFLPFFTPGYTSLLTTLGIPLSHHPGYTPLLDTPWVYTLVYTTVRHTLGIPHLCTPLGIPHPMYTPGYTPLRRYTPGYTHLRRYTPGYTTIVHTLGIPP